MRPAARYWIENPMLDFAEDEKLAQSAIRAWCTQNLEPKVCAMEAGEESIYPTMRAMGATFGIADLARAHLAKARELATRTDPARADNGVGASASLMAILMMELSRCCPGFALAFGASLGLFGGAVMARGTLAQKEKWALPALTLEKIGAWALTEPGAGSDAFGSMQTTAQKADGGWILKGAKTFITNAPFADLFVVYARLGGEGADGGVGAFVVDRSARGVATSEPFAKMGMHASPTGELFLDDVFVNSDQLLGGEDAANARGAAKASLSNERFGMTPMCLGILDRCFDESVKYAKERQQWGRPIASYQLVQEKIAKMYTAKTIAKTLLLRQLEAERARVSLPAEEASAAKLYCARITTECALDAVQLMGGAGYMTGSVVEMMARDAKLFQIGGGTDEIQILRIAREVLGA
jgi:alkylation response protein AidB-like acyl-CoA dehydrogenase